MRLKNELQFSFIYRATAAAARQLGLEPHLILRTKRAQDVQEGKQDFGMVGNVLFDRLVGSECGAI